MVGHGESWLFLEQGQDKIEAIFRKITMTMIPQIWEVGESEQQEATWKAMGCTGKNTSFEVKYV